MRRSLRLVAAMLWLLDLGACAAEPPAKAPVAMKARPRADASHVALGGAQKSSHALSPSPEMPEVSGQSLARPREQNEERLSERFNRARPLAVQHGSASYYADKFAGRSTASGAPYEPRGFTAAHRSLPFGTVLRVTRVEGGQVVYVRVTDRGPYGPRGRILDLSRAAAEQLGMMRAGVVKVKAEVVEYGPRKKRRRRR
jgi:rare lipoprotein A